MRIIISFFALFLFYAQYASADGMTNGFNGSSGSGVAAVNGTANQVSVSTTAGTATVSLPAAVVAPGSLGCTTFIINGTSTIVAAGTTQGTATQITTSYVLASSPEIPFGIILPAGASTGTYVVVQNTSNVPFYVYPPSGQNIDAGSNNVATLIPANETIAYQLASTGTWWTIIDAITAGSGITVTHEVGGNVMITNINPVSILNSASNGSGGGTFQTSMLIGGAGGKQFTLVFNAVTDAGRTINFPTAFLYQPDYFVGIGATGVTATVTKTGITLPALVAQTGVITVAGI